MPIDILHRLARGEANYKMRIGPQIVSNYPRDQRRSSCFCGWIITSIETLNDRIG